LSYRLFWDPVINQGQSRIVALREWSFNTQLITILRCSGRNGSILRISAESRSAYTNPSHRYPARSQRVPRRTPLLPGPLLRLPRIMDHRAGPGKLVVTHSSTGTIHVASSWHRVGVDLGVRAHNIHSAYNSFTGLALASGWRVQGMIKNSVLHRKPPRLGIRPMAGQTVSGRATEVLLYIRPERRQRL